MRGVPLDSLDVLLRVRGDLESLARELGQGDIEEGFYRRATDIERTAARHAVGVGLLRGLSTLLAARLRCRRNPLGS